jgi:hypothetical protein
MLAEQRRTVVIVGMHRSGTSAVAGAINLLGAQQPKWMLQGGPANPLGYFEAYGVIHVNDWILRKAGSTWYDSLGFAPDSVDPVTRGTAMALINIALSVEFGDASLLLLKDPRLCLLLEYWLPMLDATHIAPTVLLVLRHPAEVITSLAKRDTFPEPLAAATWLHYMLAAEYATRGRRRAIISYDSLLHDWRVCLDRAGGQTGFAWPIAFDAIAEQMPSRLNGSLRHHRSDMVGAGMPQQVAALMQPAFETLLALEAGDAPRHLHRLDDIRAEFTTWRLQHGQSLANELLDGHVLRRLPNEVIPDEWMQIAEGAARSIAPTATGV